MPPRPRLRRACLALAGVIAGTAIFVAPADANHHIMQIREVFPGTSDTGFVELQMWAGGQDVVTGQEITVYGPTGVLTHTFTFSGNPTGGGANSGDNQRTILVGENSAAGDPDFTDNALNIPAGGGAVCFLSHIFDAIDCVSWGNFTGSLPSAAGTPASPAGVTAGKSLTRSIAQGCATALDQPDDSGDSATDFAEQDPSPRNNSVAPTETVCPPAPNTTLSTGAPANPTTITGGTFTFSGTGSFTGFECRLDAEAFASCVSPKSYPSATFADGTHTFAVRAVGPGGPDASPATHTWRVDTTPPDTQVNDPKPADPNADASASLAFQALGSLASGETSPTFDCRLIRPSVPNPAFTACTSPSVQPTPVTDTYTFEVRARDQAGNVDPVPASHTWAVDRTAPDTLIDTQPTDPSPLNTADFTYHSTEASSTFKCKLDTGPVEDCNDPGGKGYASLNDGQHTFAVFAVDALGNADATAASYTWAVDASSDPPPETTITKAPKKKGTDKTPTIEFTATPAAGATFECRVDANPFAACSSPHTTAKLKVARHIFQVRASGPGGVDTSPAEAGFKIVKKH